MKRMAALSFLVLCLVTSLDAKQGAQLVLHKQGGQTVSGELLAVKRTALIMKESLTSLGIVVDIKDLESMQVLGKPPALQGGAIGLALGAGLGALAGTSADAEIRSSLDAEPKSSTARSASPNHPFDLAVAGFVAGGILGELISPAAKGDTTVQVVGRSEAEIEKLLKWLRSIAAFDKESY